MSNEVRTESLLLRGGRVIDPASRVDALADLLVRDGRIEAVEPGISAGADRVIDAAGCLVTPGLVDMHVHFRVPGQEHKEDMATGSAAAAAGGFTSVCTMPNTSPVNDCPAVTRDILERARLVGKTRVYPVGAITVGLAGEELTDFVELAAAGVVALSDDGRGLDQSALMRKALERAAAADLLLIQHCEDPHLSGGGAMNEGPVSARTGVSAQPPQAESVMLSRDVELVALTGCRYHMAHLSAAASVDHVRRAKAAGLPITCEVAPHHFSLTDDACLGLDTDAKVNPPLRSASDLSAVRAGIADGTLDVIATDHAPHAASDKALPFDAAAFGISGLETAVALSLQLWRDGVVSLPRLVAMMTCNPARILGLTAGTLAAGAPADVTVVDPGHRWVVDVDALRSRGKNTPFAGQELQGRVRCTIVGGQLVHEP